MAKKKELTEEETIAELQKKIDAYNRRVAAERQLGGGGARRPSPGTMTLVKPGGGKRPKPGDTVMRPQPVKPKPGKPTRPGDSIMKPLPVKPGMGTDKKYRAELQGPKNLKGTR